MGNTDDHTAVGSSARMADAVTADGNDDINGDFSGSRQTAADENSSVVIGVAMYDGLVRISYLSELLYGSSV